MARRNSRYQEVIEEINLVPIMNLVLCLIPLVLFKTQLVKVGMINVSAPKIGPSSSKPQPDKDDKPLGLTVSLSDEGFMLKATGANLSELLGVTAAENGAIKINKITETYVKDNKDIKMQSYDYIKLYNHLSTLKDKYPDEKLLTLTATSKIPFKYIIRTTDVIRYRFKEASGFKNIKDISKAAKDLKYEKVKEEVKNEKGQMETKEAYKALWDQVTFAIAQ